MNDERLRKLLRETPIPDASEAEERGLRVVRAAFEDRPPPPRHPRLRRLAIALAAGLLLCGLVLSPAGAQVRDWIGDVFEPGVRDAEPALTNLPGGGRLLVESAAGPWVVQPDGSHRRLGDFEDAGWSPRGLFVVVASGRTLTAVEPDGNARWSLSRPVDVSEPRWSPSGIRIAYLAGSSIRVVAGDGAGDALVAANVAAVGPEWSPGGAHVLAYVGGGELRIANTDTGERLAAAPALPGVRTLEWSPDGSALLQVSPGSVRLHRITLRKTAARLAISSGRALRLPAESTVRRAAYAPRGEAVALLLGVSTRGGHPSHSELVLAGPEASAPRRVFSAPGRLTDLAWSPDGRRILIAWRAADQWLFIPLRARGKVTAVDDISRQFSPGAERPSFPVVDVSGWCCPP